MENVGNQLFQIFFNSPTYCIKRNFAGMGPLIRCINAREVKQFTCSSFFVEALWITSLARLEISSDVHLMKGLMACTPRAFSINTVGRNKSTNANDTCIGKESRNLTDTSDIFRSILGTEAEVDVKAPANVVAIENVAGISDRREFQFECHGKG